MNALGCRWQPSVKGPGSRIAGKSLIHSRLAMRSDGHPGLVVFRTCHNLIRTLPSLVYDRQRPEDIAANCEDHAVEALRCGLTRKGRAFRLVNVAGL